MNVVWTAKALKTYFDVSDYIYQVWGNKAVRKFANTVEKVIREISSYPYMFEESQKFNNVRKGFITEHTILFYRVKPQKKIIEILLFWDNRQDDQKRPF